MMTTQRTKYDKEFKQKLVELAALGYKMIEEFDKINSNFKHAA